MNPVIAFLQRRAIRKAGWDLMLVERRNPEDYASSYSSAGYGWHEGKVHKVRKMNEVYVIHHKAGHEEYVRIGDPNFRFTAIS